MLKGKEIILGVTGGIAAYKSVELLRLLTKAGATVHVVMTASAQQFVAPLTFQTLSANPVHTELFNLIAEREIGHISLADRAHLCIIAPATANCIGKLANGIADDMLTTTVMATKAPVLLAPAMNVNMYQNPLYLRNEEVLRAHGYRFADPVRGALACGWEGEGKMQDPSVILEEALALLSPQDLAGETVLVTAGPTREELDPVRFISNHSSGKMGYAIARAARMRGARVILVSGPVALVPPCGVETICVGSAEEMRRRTLDHLRESSIIVKAAAVSDYRPALRAADKVKKTAATLTLELVKNADILQQLGEGKGDRILVGFAAETERLQEHATRKLAEKNLDLIVANDVGQPGAGFDIDTNIVTLFYRNGRREDLPCMAKDELAWQLLDRIVLLRSAVEG
jgi:phosphopantothenoylcysteine decarboxylase/phosphopantothenate--cysteine ligase